MARCEAGEIKKEHAKGSKIVEISDTIEEEKNRVEAFSGSVDKVLSNMDEIQECTNVNEAVSKDLKKEIKII